MERSCLYLTLLEVGCILYTVELSKTQVVNSLALFSTNTCVFPSFCVDDDVRNSGDGPTLGAAVHRHRFWLLQQGNRSWICVYPIPTGTYLLVASFVQYMYLGDSHAVEFIIRLKTVVWPCIPIVGPSLCYPIANFLTLVLVLFFIEFSPCVMLVYFELKLSATSNLELFVISWAKEVITVTETTKEGGRIICFLC